MQLIQTATTNDGASTSFQRTSIARVSRGWRQDRQGDWNYGVYINGKNTEFKGWINVYGNKGDIKLYQGQYVYVDAVGQMITDVDIQDSFDALAAW